MQGSYLGLSYSNDEVQATLDSLNAVYEKHNFDTIKQLTAKALSKGKVVGWHQGGASLDLGHWGLDRFWAIHATPQCKRQ